MPDYEGFASSAEVRERFSRTAEVVANLLSRGETIDVVPGRLYLYKDGTWSGQLATPSLRRQRDDIRGILTEFVFAATGLSVPEILFDNEEQEGLALIRLNDLLLDSMQRLMRSVAGGC